MLWNPKWPVVCRHWKTKSFGWDEFWMPHRHKAAEKPTFEKCRVQSTVVQRVIVWGSGWLGWLGSPIRAVKKLWKTDPHIVAIIWKQINHQQILPGWCSTLTLLLICSSFSRENDHPLLICSSLSTSQLHTCRKQSQRFFGPQLCVNFHCCVSLPWPETNSEFAPENGWLEYDRFLFGRPIFRGFCC